MKPEKKVKVVGGKKICHLGTVEMRDLGDREGRGKGLRVMEVLVGSDRGREEGMGKEVRRSLLRKRMSSHFEAS